MTLLAAARDAVARRLGRPPVAWKDASWLDETGATFVTLRAQGELRGCVGTLEAFRPLRDDVRANAVGAATRDHRFDPIRPDEYPHVHVAVSLLSRPEAWRVACQEEAVRGLVPGRDGLLLEDGPHRATFLPHVWEQLPDPGDFLRHLKRKAGLPADHWSGDLKLSRYRAELWSEAEEAP